MTDQPNPPELEITDSVPSGLKVTTELPYRVLHVGSFAGPADSGSLSGPIADGVTEVTADKFDDVMASACPTVNFTTSDPLAAGSVMVEVNLKFASMRAFQPKELVQQLPATRSLMTVRDKIVERMRGKVSTDALLSAIGDSVTGDASLAWLADSVKWTAAAPPASASAVDAVLGQLDLGDDEGDDSAPPPKSEIGALVTAAAQDGSSIPAEESSALRRTLGEIDRRISAWLTTVLHAPQVKPIEAAWRSLAFLISNTDFRKGLRISVLHAAPDDMLDRFRDKLIDPVFDEGAPAPDLIVVDAQYGNGGPEMEAVDEWAQHAASLPAVVVTGASPKFFGIKHAWQMTTLPTISNIFDQWQFAKWKSLRNEPYARSLGMIFGRCLLRAPHGRGEAADLEFAYREEAVGENDFLWGGGAMAAAVAVVHSVADVGWPTAMAGFVHGRVEGFATAMGGKKGDKQFGPTDTFMPQPKIEELAVVGVCAAVGIHDHDDAIIWNGLSAGRPNRAEPDAFLEVSLPYQLFAARLSGLLFELKPHLAGLSGEAVAKTVKQHVCDWLALGAEPDAETLSVLTRPAEDAPATIELAVTVTPPQEILPGGIPVVMGYRLS